MAPTFNLSINKVLQNILKYAVKFLFKSCRTATFTITVLVLVRKIRWYYLWSFTIILMTPTSQLNHKGLFSA